ncbi:LacI family DNA-binding transcriptional regulator [Variovorax sp. PAMC 28711]|uniref:LacI family DNA-binding transcriptional regulator n=1 Tax=Variovorax sp. PAMC 28711 TaxID=1795631 RepID=UPI00078B8EF0|nr:substrate-binding domain-containing protein [Variovorax sp. PAMC 28711]AMM26362.1 hypothetical protein AX767_19920 [Variovorax sp. PAMC 28711]
MNKKTPAPTTRNASRRPAAVASVQEVARQAGVSPATVSRAFNSPHQLNQDTLKRVTAAAQALRYQPNGVARSLRRSRSMAIGAVIPSFRHGYFGSMVEGLQVGCRNAGYSLLIATSDYDEKKELDAVHAMVRQGVDGLVLVGVQRDPELAVLLEQSGLPCIVTWSYSPDVACIGFDHQKAMDNATRHLLDLRHERFAVIMAFLRVSDRERDRLAGIEGALAARGLPLPADRIVFAGGSGLQDGRNAMRAVLQQHPDTTAVICANDLLAAGALMECRTQGIAVPERMSITGYSDLEVAAAMDPGITTVSTPSEKLGLLAAEWLARKLAGETVMERCELETQLIIRGSTGPAASTARTGTP